MNPRTKARWQAVGLGEDPPRPRREPPLVPRSKAATGSISVAVAHDTRDGDRQAPAGPAGPRLAGAPFWAMLALSITSVALTVGFELRRSAGASHAATAASQPPVPLAAAAPTMLPSTVAVQAPPPAPTAAAPSAVDLPARLPLAPTGVPVIVATAQTGMPIVSAEATTAQTAGTASTTPRPIAAKPKARRAAAKAAKVPATAPPPASPGAETADKEAKAILDALSETAD